MATAFKKSDQALADLREDLENHKVVQVGPDKTARQWGSDVAKMCKALEELSAVVGKMVSKAKETDPDKQVYGKSMVAKVLDLGSRLDSTVKEANELQDKVAPLAEAEEARVAMEEAARKAEEDAEAARLAEEARRAEAARLAEEEAARKAAEEAARRAADAAKAAEEEAARAKKAEDARLAQQAKEKAEAEAKAKAEADAKAAAAGEGAKKAEAEAKLKEQAEEAAKALAAAAASALGASSQAPASSGQGAAASAPSANLPAGVIKVVAGSSELQKLLSDAGPSKLVVVDFSAPWCGPCRAIAPFLEQLATEYSSSCVFVAVDCEASPANRELAAEAAIRAFPTFHFYKGSQRVHEMRGANREGIRAQITAHAAAAASSGSSGAGQAAARAPGQMTKDLMAALQVLKSNCSFDEFCNGTRTLVTFVSNVLAHPGDAKYRRVRMSNARFNSSLGVRTGGVACMESVGFRKAQEGSDWFLVMDTVPPELQQVKTLLEEAMRSVAPPPPARTAPPPATGAVAGGFPGGLGAGGLLGAMGAGGLPGQGFGGLPGMEGLGGGAFGAQPPGMDAMMQQMMSNPQMMQAANRMMQNPQMMSHIRNMMAGGGVDPSSMAQLQQQMMADPEMQQAAMQMMGGMGGGLGGMMGSPGFPASATNTSVQPPAPPATSPSQAAAPTSNTSGAAGGGNEQDPQNMSDEELLQLAIRRSMEDDSGNGGGA